MVTLLVWCAVVFGVTNIVTQSRLFLGVRARLPETGRLAMLGILVRCPMCFSWWVGAALEVAGFTVLPALAGGIVVRALLAGAAASAVAWTWHVLLLRASRARRLDDVSSPLQVESSSAELDTSSWPSSSCT